jgi:hypothetical protein
MGRLEPRQPRRQRGGCRRPIGGRGCESPSVLRVPLFRCVLHQHLPAIAIATPPAMASHFARIRLLHLSLHSPTKSRRGCWFSRATDEHGMSRICPRGPRSGNARWPAQKTWCHTRRIKIYQLSSPLVTPRLVVHIIVVALPLSPWEKKAALRRDARASPARGHADRHSPVVTRLGSNRDLDRDGTVFTIFAPLWGAKIVNT